VERFVAARLLVTGLDRTRGDETVEVTHEALIRRWDKLRHWIDNDREFLRTRERIATAAKRWQEEKQDPSLLLPPGRPLAEGEEILETRRSDLGTETIRHIEASTLAARARVAAEQMAQRRSTRRTQWFAGTMTALAAALGVVAYYAYDKSVQAEQSLEAADERLLALCAQNQAIQDWVAQNLEAAIYDVQGTVYDFGRDCRDEVVQGVPSGPGGESEQ
jgi:hypothetical protein